ncbi:hypothetical protein LVJ94_35255 [Pendulispora rubella]|uniref:Uncharacterized protein n=1 Tax=Pendulispora rubella TaxID=2741070 RepID=A0ABZ2KX78_9BACT
MAGPVDLAEADGAPSGSFVVDGGSRPTALEVNDCKDHPRIDAVCFLGHDLGVRLGLLLRQGWVGAEDFEGKVGFEEHSDGDKTRRAPQKGSPCSGQARK